MARIGQHLRAAAASLLVLVQSSCFTMGLWGFEPDARRDPITGQEEATFRYDEDTEWSWALFFGRIVATPVALCLDCLTAPIQAWMSGDDDDDRRGKRPGS